MAEPGSERMGFSVRYRDKKFKIMVRVSEAHRLRVEKIKTKLAAVTQIPVHRQQLLLNGAALRDGMAGSDFGLAPTTVLTLEMLEEQFIGGGGLHGADEDDMLPTTQLGGAGADGWIPRSSESVRRHSRAGQTIPITPSGFASAVTPGGVGASRGSQGGGGGGLEDLRVCFGGCTFSSCCLFGSFFCGLNDGCRRVFKRSFQCCVSSA